MDFLRQRVLSTPREGFWPVLIGAVVVELVAVVTLANAQRTRAHVDTGWVHAGTAEAADPDARRYAKVIWETQCASCHGLTGRGDGVAARTLRFAPPDLTTPEWQASVDDAFIAYVTIEGGAAVGLSATMVARPELRGRPGVVRGLIDIVRGCGAPASRATAGAGTTLSPSAPPGP